MAPPPFSRYQKLITALLAALQFTIVLDFMVLSPLGAILMPALGMSPRQFGYVVSAYAFSAGASGLVASGFADRFDRKRFLLFFYGGFITGTLACALAGSYTALLIARVVTGLFAGVVGSIGFAIIADVFPPASRGRVMGVVQTAFAASQIMGIPLGLVLANRFGWNAPFVFIVAVAVLLAAVAAAVIRPLREHLTDGPAPHPLAHVVATVTRPRYLEAFATTALLSVGGFMLMPFGSAFSVRNLGLSLTQLPIVYFVTGLFSIAAGPLLGRLTDLWGTVKVFTSGSLLTLVLVLVYTNLGVTPIALVILVSVLLFIGISGRMVASQALISTIPSPRERGAFMAVSSSLQQLAGGAAASLAGWLIHAPDTGPLERFEWIGYAIAGATVLTMGLVYRLSRHQPTAHSS